MDIFKLLSRGTKRVNKTSKSTITRVPSAGTAANPQLFHDPVPETRGQKRKQDDVDNEENDESSSESELNYFAPKKEQRHEKNSVAPEKKKPKGSEVSLKQQSAPAKLLDDAECRQILRSHRLKLTILPAKDVKKKSHKKKVKSGAESKTKEEPERIFPQPLMAFTDLRTTYGISKRLSENLSSQAYKIPTEVQMGSLPLLLDKNIAVGLKQASGISDEEGIDLLAVAPTGSGKTLAFLIPALNGIMKRRANQQDEKVHSLDAIIVAPTKELASQIVNEGRKLVIGTRIKVVLMRKGMRVVQSDDSDGGFTSDEGSSEDDSDEDEEMSKSLKKSTQPLQPVTKADILVTTPLMLVHALTSGSDTKLQLPTVQTLILDEADVLLDQLFRDQTLSIWNACTNPSLHVSLWSATMGSNIESLASSTISSRRIKLSLQNTAPLIRLVVGLKDSAIPNITHRLIWTDTEVGKLHALRQLLHPTSSSAAIGPPLRPPFLVFTQTIPRAMALHSELLYDIPVSAGGSSRIAVLHSALSSTARSAVMARFRAGQIWILITTDLLSRGVDFRGINGVVNYDFPTSGAAYIHRVGRTGRAGREGGVAVTLYTREDKQYLRGIANIIRASEKAAGKSEEEGTVKSWMLDALPVVSKNARKELKKRGVKARRTGVDQGLKDGMGGEMARAKAKAVGRISTKSGYERRLEDRRRGAIEGSKRRVSREEDSEGEGEWGGIDE